MIIKTTGFWEITGPLQKQIDEISNNKCVKSHSDFSRLKGTEV